jgi:hypothetical protein
MRAFLALFVFSFTIQASAQSVADIARRERERQKQTETRSKGRYTNANAAAAAAAAPSQPSANAPSPQKPSEKKEEVAAKPTGPTDNKGRDEKYWRDAFKKSRDLVRQADEKVQVQEAKLKDLNTQLLRQSDIYNKENVLGPIISQTQKDLETAKAEAEQARNDVTKLEDELRASGGLPGWAR